MDIGNLYCIYDKPNECYCISDDSNIPMCDADIAIRLKIDIDKYLNFLIIKGDGYFLDDTAKCVGFKSKEDAENCLKLLAQHEFKKKDNIIKNNKDEEKIIKFVDNLIEKYRKVKNMTINEYSTNINDSIQELGIECDELQEDFRRLLKDIINKGDE